MTNQSEKPNFYQLYQLVGKMDGKLEETLKKLENHDKRINDIEKIQDQFIGKTSIIGTLTGFIGGVIVTLITPFLKK